MALNKLVSNLFFLIGQMFMCFAYFKFERLCFITDQWKLVSYKILLTQKLL